jgi:hypothetical protein
LFKEMTVYVIISKEMLNTNVKDLCRMIFIINFKNKNAYATEKDEY